MQLYNQLMMCTISEGYCHYRLSPVPCVPCVPRVPHVRFSNLFDGPRLDCTSRCTDTVVKSGVVCVQYITERDDLCGRNRSPCHWVPRCASGSEDTVRRRAAEDVSYFRVAM